MKSRTIIILLCLLLPALLIYHNKGNLSMWFFGDASLSAKTIFVLLFGCGFIAGLLIAWPRHKKQRLSDESSRRENEYDDTDEPQASPGRLSDEDRDYIS
jgi:hypothetical protein